MIKTENKKIKICSLILALTFFCSILICFIFGKETMQDVLCGYALKQVPIYSVEKDEKVISISFDCAWGNEYTEKLLEEMRLYNVKCTFFMVSFWAEKYPESVKRIIEEGHEIGTHSKTHSRMSNQSAKEIDEELEYSVKVIETLTEEKVELFRPPFGDYDDLLLERAKAHGLYTIQWSVDSLDWKDLTAKDIAYRVIGKVKNGSIILCHNNGKHTAESLPLIFADLTAKGYGFVKISELIYKDNYKMANDGTQMKDKND